MSETALVAEALERCDGRGYMALSGRAAEYEQDVQDVDFEVVEDDEEKS